MNNIFNADRFCRLFIKHTAEHYRSYLMSLAVLLGVMLLGGSFIVYLINIPMEASMQIVLFSFVLVLAGTIFTSTVFSDIGEKKRAMISLTLPASHLEKYMVVWIYSFLLFVLIYTGCFYLVILLLTGIKHFPGQPNEIVNIFAEGVGFQVFLLYAFLHSIAICGAIYFEKLHFIKTAFIFFISFGFLIMFNNVIQHMLLGKDVAMNIPFGGVRFTENKGPVDINITMAQQGYIFILLGVLALMFWIAAYHRIKEKQV